VGATAAEASAESDEQTGNRHNNERTHRPKECGAWPERKTQRGAANQAEKKHRPPCLVCLAVALRRRMRLRHHKKATEYTGDTWNLSAQHSCEEAGETDQDSSD